ncbi:acetate metabolism transcriptional regulator RamB [Dietzia maris]|uniref:acetate metabolism transcriptional regulator RamB n=1 Tax=Dietzia maris TaxID=37915 RepID=UPI00223BAA41|nr:acetate metabolism transcriptional regulator RamB [Dietzia maris]MCT1434765.1 acetate metabolism transcriptional regulator RamB [Dietzia maris]MCT1521983.1 acetate metabolism transcriptional regulator RamB [Dietzia maris]
MTASHMGSRLRRLREENGLTQAAFAQSLGLSSSYLNQLEKDARPVTSRVLVKISEVYGVDSAFFASDSDTRLIAAVTEALTDTQLSAEVPAAEVVDLVRAHPALARAFMLLHQRYRNSADLLAALTETRNVPDTSVDRSVLSMPHEEVRDYFYQRQNYIDSLDTAAEDLTTRIRLNRGDVRAELEHRLSEAHGVRIARRVDLPDGLWHRYSTEDRRLDLSAHLTPGQQAFRVASELAFLEHRDLLDSLVEEGSFSSPAAVALALRGLASYFAAAVLMPYQRFLDTAEDFRYDVERLMAFHATGYETVCHRLSTLQRPGAAGVPFSFVRVDRAGNMSKRQSATGFHFTTSGGTCPLWNIYESFSFPGKIMRQVAQMPDDRLHLWVSRTVTTRPMRFGQPRKTFAIGLGCEARHAHRTVYAQGLDLDDVDAATKIGSGCRMCDRAACPQRAFPPLNHALRVDAHRSSLSPYLLDQPSAPGGTAGLP